MPKALDIITNAFIEANWIAPGESVDAGNAEWARNKLNRIIDQAQAIKRLAWNVNFTQFTLIANKQPHTIGPTGDFVTAWRPLRIEAAALILAGGSSDVDIPMNVRDDAWWANQRVKAIKTGVPTDLYYSPDFPDGSLYLWPVPNVVRGIRLETWVSLGQFSNLSTNYQLPPGYEEWLTTRLGSEMEGPNRQMLEGKAASALRIIETPNMGSPRIASADYGQPTKRSDRGTYYDGWSQ